MLVEYWIWNLFTKWCCIVSFRSKKKVRLEEDDEDDLTGDLEDPTPDTSIAEVKITPANAAKPDLQVQARFEKYELKSYRKLGRAAAGL